MLKKELRIKYKELRKSLFNEQIESKSIEIANNLLQLDIWNKTYFHVFLPIIEQKEVDTEFVLNILHGKDKEIIVSKSDFNTRQMTHFLLTDSTKIAKNEYNIPEPTNGLEVQTSTIEVVFVPLLAFDKTGNRVGYGKGFYDNFLSNCNPQTIKIGLSFFEAVDLIEGVSNDDVKLDFCVTPSQIYRF